MARGDPEYEDAAPACPHDDLEPYFEGSPVADAFAPGMLERGSLAEETPWRGRPGHAPDEGRLAARADAVRAAQERAASTPPPAPALRVLVVHTDLATRRQVAAVLEDHGLAVSTCAEAEQAVLQVLHERPDAVISEIGQSDVDAVALCRTLQERAAGIPVLLVAAGDDEAPYSLVMEAGAADYLRRPLTPAFVAERVRIAVSKARSRVGDPQETTRQLNRALRRQELKIQSLFELSKNVFGCLELEELYHGFLLTAMGQLGLAAGALYHLDGPSGGRPRSVVSRGVPVTEARRLLDFRAGLGAYLLRAPQPVLLDPAYCPDELGVEVEAARRAGFAVACPMASKGIPVGVGLFGPRVAGDDFTAEDLLLLSAVCNFAGPALDGARLYSELQQTYVSTVRAFVSSIEAKDAYTRGHSERVADYARVMADALGLKRRDLDMVVIGAMLHDIGKIGVSEGILNKPGPLTPEEWRVVRAHPEMGARIVGHIEYLAPAVAPILHHHERVDGRGYPHGLHGDEIEMGARIVTVVDSFDAMTTDRPYRRALEPGDAVRLLRVHAGRQFDPDLVEVFVDCLEKGAVALRD